MGILSWLRSQKRPVAEVGRVIPPQQSTTDAVSNIASARDLLLHAAKSDFLKRYDDAARCRANAVKLLLDVLMSEPESLTATVAWNLLGSLGIDRKDLVLRTLPTLSAVALRGDYLGVLSATTPGALTERSYNGYTPLHWAVEGGNIEIVYALIDAGVPFNVRAVGGWTPLHMAAARGSAEIAELLIDRGADVNARRFGGYTPLHQAARAGDAAVARKLIVGGASRTDETDETADEKNMTPAALASLHGHAKLAEYLASVVGKRKEETGQERMSSTVASPEDAVEPDITQYSDAKMIEVLVELATYYARGALSRDNPALVASVREIGESLNRRGGLVEMRRVFALIPAVPGKRTLEMEWNGIGEWRG